MDALTVAIISKNNNEKNSKNYLITAIGPSEQKSSSSLISQVLAITIFVFAVYLSWGCNSKCFPSMSDIEKGFRAFFAGIFGSLYLIIYFISWSAGCKTCVPV